MQKFKAFLIILGVAGLASGIGLVVLLSMLTPDRLSNVVIIYLVLALFTFCLFALLGLFIRRMFGQREMLHLYFRTALRQSLWLTLLLGICLILSSLKLFSLLNAGLLVLTLVCLEFYLSTRRPNF